MKGFDMARKHDAPCEAAGIPIGLKRKAEIILRLRSRLPSMEGIYFSPSTGEFFRSEVDGLALIRCVVPDDELPADAADEIAAKRAAALLCSFEEQDAKLRRQIETAQAVLSRACEAREQLPRDFEAARDIVERFEIP